MPNTTYLANNGSLYADSALADIEAIQPSGAHVGTVTANFTMWWNGCALDWRQNQNIMAYADLKAALIAANAPVTWAN